MKTEIIEITISSRYNGPPGSGNGGYVSGLIAKHLSGPVNVRLLAPPPLDKGLRLEISGEKALLFDGTLPIARAHRSPLHIDVPKPPSMADAQEASKSFVGFENHVFPTCFVCGTKRSGSDGLQIFPGPVQEGPVLAAPWVPGEFLADKSGRVASEYLWAALDCTGAFAIWPPSSRLILLGEFSARIDDDVSPGAPCIVLGWPEGSEGRKHFAGTAVYSENGNLIAVARATWIEVPMDTLAGR